MNMNKLIYALAGSAMMLAAPAFASVPLVSSPITVTTADINKNFTYNFNGIVEGQDQAGLESAITFRLTGVNGNVWTFAARVDNTLSTDPVGGRITGFGFDGSPAITGGQALAGPFGTFVTNAGFPQIGGQTRIDFCVTSGSNCQGGAGGGVADGLIGFQTFELSFGSSPLSVTFDNFIVRYQSITGSQFGSSGIGLGTGGGGNGGFDPGGIPEPSSWAMLIAGFGLVGAVARRRKASGLTVAA
jgi:hypothetical protein